MENEQTEEMNLSQSDRNEETMDTKITSSEGTSQPLSSSQQNSMNSSSEENSSSSKDEVTGQESQTSQVSVNEEGFIYIYIFFFLFNSNIIFRNFDILFLKRI